MSAASSQYSFLKFQHINRRLPESSPCPDTPKQPPLLKLQETDPPPEQRPPDNPDQTELLPGTRTNEPGTLYLIPTPLGRDPVNRVLPVHVMQTLHALDTFFVENIRQAVSFLQWARHPLPDFKCHFYELHKRTPGEELLAMLQLLRQGRSAGVLSEAGCPGVADPGGEMVRLAHASHVPVVPLVGPSSLILALMASGLNGQQFTFHGYLAFPGEDRSRQIQQLEYESGLHHTTQIFIEAPYRNNNLLAELVERLREDTRLCTASNLTLENERVISKPVSEWRKMGADLHQQPTVFLLLAGAHSTPGQKRQNSSEQRASPFSKAEKGSGFGGKNRPARGKKRRSSGGKTRK